MPGACVHPLIFSIDVSAGSLASTGQMKSLKPILTHPRQGALPPPCITVEVLQARSEQKGSVCLDSFG